MKVGWDYVYCLECKDRVYQKQLTYFENHPIHKKCLEEKLKRDIDNQRKAVSEKETEYIKQLRKHKGLPE